MDQNTSREQLESRAGLDNRSKQEAPQKPDTTREVKTRAKEVLKTESVETLEGAEGAELIDGKISEVAADDKSQAPVGTAPKVYSADQVEEIRTKLLKALPPQEVMVREIKRTLLKKQKVLNKRMDTLMKRSHTKAWELSIIVQKLREVERYFSTLAHATYELIKHLWLKIVHGV